MGLVNDTERALQDWIRAHRVTWERQPHYELAGPKRVHVGYDVRLFARHPQPLHDDPGCAECVRIHRTLCDVASAALPETGPTTGVSIEPFHPMFALRPESDWAPEVEVAVEVFQPGAVAPSDSDEDACVRRMEDELRRLGVQPRTWRAPR